MKANLTIDPSKGRSMFGVLDETGLLNEGEVFVQYTSDISYGETTTDTKFLSGTVLVTKNPCYLPGDVRKFIAKDTPSLREHLGHIVDCIVFPQKGSRPHPNEMSGSDLDGDEYSVLWDEDLIFHQQNQPAGEFPTKTEKLEKNVTVPDMIEWLIEFIKNDQIGSISHAYLAKADKYGVSSKSCLQIARKCCDAVDFARSGVGVCLTKEEKPVEYPDFMEERHAISYKSKKALRKMYRIATDFESENELVSYTYQDIKVNNCLVYAEDSNMEHKDQNDNNTDYNDQNDKFDDRNEMGMYSFPGYEGYLENAIKARNKYNTLLKCILRDYGIQHEAEAFSGAFTKLHCRFKERTDSAEVEKVIIACIKQLFENTRKYFMEEFKEFDIRMLQKASAWYVATYSDSSATFLSFPWTISNILELVKSNVCKCNSVSRSPIVLKMNAQITKCLNQGTLPDIFVNQNDSFDWVEFLKESGYQDFHSCETEQALKVLIKWGEDKNIIEKWGEDGNIIENSNEAALMNRDTFIQIFLHVSEISKYVSKTGDLIVKECNGIIKLSAAALCMEFWRFCLKLRFYNKYEISKKILPFHIDKYSAFSEKAVIAYHQFAISGVFKNLYPNTERFKDSMNLKPLFLNSSLFENHSNKTLKRAKDVFKRKTGVEYISLRYDYCYDKVILSAHGTEESLKRLKIFARKDSEKLQKLFK